MSHFLYFAYGSNLLAGRLTARCPSAAFAGPAHAPDHATAFDVRAADGSTKLGLRRVEGATAHGALWRIAEVDRAGLAAAEGANYVEVGDFAVVDANGEKTPVVTWLPKRPAETGRPWAWYRELATAGARECGLPEATIAGLETAEADEDPVVDRPARRAAMIALAAPHRV